MTGYVRPGFGAPAAGSLDWQTQAACRDADASLFFATETERVAARKRREGKAKAVCAGCIVRAACLDWRLNSPDQSDGGIWAGADELERTRLRKNRLRAAGRAA